MLHSAGIPREEAVYSVVSDTSVENQPLNPVQQDHEYDTAEPLNQCDSQTHSQYNTLYQEYNTSTSASRWLSPHMYDSIEETQLSKTDLDEANYDAVANSGTGLGHVKIQTGKKRNEIMSLSYEVGYQVTNNKRKEESTDYNVDDFFDDERYCKPQSTFQDVNNSFDDSTPHSVPRRAEVHDNSKSSAYPERSAIHEIISLPQSEDVEYADPCVSKRTKHSETEAQTIARSNEHHYHSLEQENVGISKATVNSTSVTKHDIKRVQHEYHSPNLTVLPVRKAEINDKSYTQTPTTLSYSTETLNDLGTMNSPILQNIEDYDFDDPRYDSVVHQSAAVLHSTHTETSPSMRLNSNHDERGAILSAMNVNPELSLNYDDAPEYSDPIDLAAVNNEPSNTHSEVNGLLFDDSIYA